MEEHIVKLKHREAVAKTLIEYDKSRGLYNAILQSIEGFCLEELKSKEHISSPISQQQKLVKLMAEEVERSEGNRKLITQSKGIGNVGFQEINSNDLKLLKDNEDHDKIYSNIKEEIVHEASRVPRLSLDGESCRHSDDTNDNATLVTDEFMNLLTEACKDNPELHIIPPVTYNQIVQSYGESLNNRDKEVVPGWKKIVPRERSDHLDKMESCSSSSIALESNTKIILKLAQAPQSKKDHEKQSKQCTQVLQPLNGHETRSKLCTQVDFKQKIPEWLERFFRRTFFDPCSEHPIRRNELNKYCIDCDASLCQYCLSLSSHVNHRLLKIYRHVYKDVVPLDEIERHIDCTQIQPYRCNRQMVIALTPLPHSGGKTSNEATCHTCNRKLIEYDVYSYCSISCKVEAFTKKNNDSVPPFLSIDHMEQNEMQEPNPEKTTRKRKGIPHRAPLF